jgi:hypothetical protein
MFLIVLFIVFLLVDFFFLFDGGQPASYKQRKRAEFIVCKPDKSEGSA